MPPRKPTPPLPPAPLTPHPGDLPACVHYEACRRIARYWGCDEWVSRCPCLSFQETTP